MQWSTSRQLLFALGALVIIGALGAGSFFFFIYEPPSCFDGEKNQDEENIDCGGICDLLCAQPNVSTVWARSVRVAPGVYHSVALIKNPNTTAQGTIPYEVSLFDENNILIARREGSITLLPGDIAPLFEANVVTGERVPVRTFVDLGVGTFKRAPREMSPVRVLSFNLNEESLQLSALIENQSALPVENITVSALLFSGDDLLINASQTSVPSLGGRERKELVFTWQEQFTETLTRIDILPRIAP